MESKMTAVEWLESKMPTAFKELTINKELIKQAKEMEKKQMKDAVLSQCTTHEGLRKIFDKQFEQYYNETYGKGGVK